uniref:Squalene monooxygenase n=1 Tax=Arion vulgaris TaxID=1028688 RepID=A0A0B7BJX4_9EUPU
MASSLMTAAVAVGLEWTVSLVSVYSFIVCSIGSWCINMLCFIMRIFRGRQHETVTRPNRKFVRGEPDVIIVGSGVAGSAMATALARDGRKVTVIERDMKEPDRVVGEILQPGGYQALVSLGLTECIDGIDAQAIKGYVLTYMEDDTSVVVPYCNQEEVKGVEAAVYATGFHNGRFVTALREKAKKEPNVTYIEGTVSKLVEDNNVVVGVQYKTKGSDDIHTIYAPLTVVVDGCFSKFRKELVTEQVTVTSHCICLVMQNCPQKVNQFAELIATKTGPVMVYPISDGCSRAFVDVRGGIPRNIEEYLLETVCPNLPEYIQQAFQDSVVNGRKRMMPASFLPPCPIIRPGVLVLGDAYNMRHPLTGAGMSVCLNDIVIWREFLQGIPDFSDYEAIIKLLRVFHLRRKSNHSFVVNVLANSWHLMLADGNKHLSEIRKAGMEYFSLGGKCVENTVSLITIMNAKPHVFFGYVMILSVYLLYYVLRTEPFWAIHRACYRSYGILLTAYKIFFPLVWSEARSLILP